MSVRKAILQRRVATASVLEITDDLRDRRGFRQVWDDLDPDIRQEIEISWVEIIMKNLRLETEL